MFLISFFGLSILASAQAAASSSTLNIISCDVGDRYQFDEASCPIELQNPGDRAIRVLEAKAFIGTDSIAPGPVIVPPHTSRYVEAKVLLRSMEGNVRHPFIFVMDDSEKTKRTASVSAYVQSVLDQHEPKFDFGVVRTTEVSWPITKSIALSSREVKDFRVVSVDEKPDWLDVSIKPDGRTIQASLKNNVPWGVIHKGSAYVKLGLNSSTQRRTAIEVTALVLGNVVPDSNPFQLGLIRSEGRHEFLLRLTSPGGKDFRLGKITLNGIKGKINVGKCSSEVPACRMIHLVVDNNQPLGKLSGVLSIELPEYKKILPIEIIGFLLSPKTKIHDMNELQSTSTAQSDTLTKLPSIENVLKTAVKVEPPPPSGSGPLLRWSVAHQSNIHGYIIYRADSETGQLLRINKELIPVFNAEDGLSGNYQWRDNTAESGKAYWYQIGFLSIDGAREDLTGREKVIAK